MIVPGVAPGAAQCGAALLRIHLPVLLLLLLNGLLEAAKVSSDSSRTSTNSVFNYELLNAETSFFLKQTNEDVEIDPTTLQVHVQPFFVFSTSMQPIFNVTYGPFSTWKPVPMSMQGLRNPSQQQSLSDLNTNWKLKSFLTENIIFSNRPIIQVLFCLLGRDWDKNSASEKMPCVDLHVFFGAQELRTSCQLKGKLGMCLGEIDLPSSWFLPDDMTSNGDSPESLPVDLYYALRSPEESGNCAPAGSQGLTYVHVLGKEETRTDLQWVGSVQLLQTPKSPPRHEVRLDDNVVIYLPARSIRHGEIIRIPVGLLKNSSVEHFALRVKGKKGVNLLEIHPSNPEVWAVNKEINSGAKHTTILVEVSKMPSPPAASANGETSSTEVLQLEFELENITSQTVTRRILWHVAYDGQSAPSEHERITSELTVSQHDIVGLVAIAPAEELLNTAVLTGRTVALPLRVLVVEESGLVTDVSEEAQCYSLDEDVLKVSAGCEYVYVNGKERQGSTRARVHVSYEHMRASLDLTVWMPKLPLQIQISDNILNPINGWQTLGPSTGRKPPDKNCLPQYQHAALRVYTRFFSDAPEEGNRVAYLAGTGWTLDVTALVRENVIVKDQKVASIIEGDVLIGTAPGSTMLQVLSPLSDSILGERAVTVSEEKVSVSGLHVTLLSGLSLSLRPSSSEPSVIVARTTGLSIFTASKQKGTLRAWIQFSDGTTSPLHFYQPKDYNIVVSTLQKHILSIDVNPHSPMPMIIAEGEGNGRIKVELKNAHVCQNSVEPSTLITSAIFVPVNFIDLGGQPLENDAQPSTSSNTDIGRTHPGQWDNGNDGSQDRRGSEDNERPADNRNVPDTSPSGNKDLEEQLSQKPRRLSDLQIGMYTLLSVFCLAILMFLVNCLFYAVQYRKRHTRRGQQEEMAHSHEWVSLKNSSSTISARALDAKEPYPATVNHIVDDGGFGSGSSPKIYIQTHRHRHALEAPPQSEESHRKFDLSTSPTSQRKKVTFATFTTSSPCEILRHHSCSGLVGENEAITSFISNAEIMGEVKTVTDFAQRRE
ncbi:LOW QUALITY PROTEIN: transmembrane protein 132C-like [Lethenteron reissneri]|uniref:LOW QUALITY PROTEIN: transmembrane protein 132C-like n=1 Tax=Lethenteron reissneri TaxID=7753 RepID=UPI002AB70BC7|nr:LOW QUALITY PROTEIN: transmembrane protein 132C-like [Lethenteron reissneri]